MIKQIITSISELRKPCKLVEEGEDISQIIQDLKDTLATKKGYGVTANQIGYNKRIAYIKVGKTELVLINSKIIEKENRIIFNEGCLSFPDIFLKTDRWNDVVFENGINGEEKYSVQGLEAIVVSHEIDHFNGKVIFDRKHKGR